VLAVGQPLAGYSSTDDRPSEQANKFDSWFQDEFRDYMRDVAESDGVRYVFLLADVLVVTVRASQMDVLYFASALLESEFMLIIIKDMSLAMGSFVMVFGYA